MQDGRPGLLADPGAWSNLAGESWIHEPKENSRNPCVLQVLVEALIVPSGKYMRMPTALVDTEGNSYLREFRPPVIGGAGTALPALLGLQSMSRQNNALEMAPVSERLTFPGPGGHTINWSPGAARYKLEKATSGHLILPCDEFEKV